jgi:lambda repressor-like predicted transcriptional regulator
MNVQYIITNDSKPEYAVIPIAEYEQLLDRLEELQDIIDLERSLKDDGETFPIEVVRRLIDESPFIVWREYRQLTLNDLSQQTGIDLETLQHIETLQISPTPQQQQLIAYALNLDIDDFS